MRFGIRLTPRCATCGAEGNTFALDGERIRMCGTCIAAIVAEATALQDERDRLYEGSSWVAWAEVHVRHAGGVVGCPLCGMAVA